jgi:hypothetical protein
MNNLKKKIENNLKIVVLVFISWAYSGALANFDTSVIPDS